MDLNHPSAALLVETCRENGLLRNQCAYVLATAFHETGQFKYMREIWGPTPTQKRYEGRKDLGNTVKGDGKKFLGRGFVQITGRRNYTMWGKRIGLDLLKEPQLAEQPQIAARILVEGMKFGTFTGKNLGDYITLSSSEFAGARRIVNGLDKADLIAGYARTFDKLLKEAGYGEDVGKAAYDAAVAAQREAAKNPPPLTPQNSTPATRGGFWASLFAILAKLFGRN